MSDAHCNRTCKTLCSFLTEIKLVTVVLVVTELVFRLKSSVSGVIHSE